MSILPNKFSRRGNLSRSSTPSRWRSSTIDRFSSSLKSSTDSPLKSSSLDDIGITKVNFSVDKNKNKDKNLTKEKLNIAIKDISNKLDRLRKIPEAEIRKLSGSALEDYRSLVRYTELLYNTSYYDLYYNEIKKRFSDLEDIIPGTIGAYFGGCLKEAPSNIGLRCSAICAGSIPPPKDKNKDIDIDKNIEKKDGVSNICPQTVVLGLPKGSDRGYDFKTLTNGTDSTDLIVYLTNATGPFSGFNDNEREILRSYGTRYIRVYQYTKDGRYIDVLEGQKSLQELPSRVDIIPTNNTPPSTNGLILILFLFTIAIVIFIIWKILTLKSN